MKKAAKVLGNMAIDAAEEPDETKSSEKMSQVPNPQKDSYLERWNNRKPPEIIELEMPALEFDSHCPLHAKTSLIR